MKDLVDDMNGWWHTRRQRLPDAYRIVDAVHFYNSMVVLEKKPRKPKSHPLRSHVLAPIFTLGDFSWIRLRCRASLCPFTKEFQGCPGWTIGWNER